MRFSSIGALALGFLAAGCSGNADRDGGNFVTIYDNSFSASVIRVPEGGLVRWLHVGQVVHNVVAVDSSWSTSAGDRADLKAGSESEHRFLKAGVYRYYCTYHGTASGQGMAGVVVVGNAEYHPSPRGALMAVSQPTGVTRHVPQEYPTIQAAVDAASPGDLVLVDKGVYREEVTVTTPSIVIRGVDRNETIVDGEFVRGNGIAIYADAVAVENMTARNAVLNGFFWTGITGFRGAWLTAYNNGDYGIYAFDASDGLLEDSYASGSPDSGFYIGECYPCRIVIRRVTAEHNALGYSGTNSGGEMYVVSSIWRNNRVGIVPASLDIELVPPQRDAVFAANLITGNSSTTAPAAFLPSIAFGSGFLVGGGVRNVIERNVIADHALDGILITSFLDKNFWPAQGNIIRNNRIIRSGRADLALGGPSATGNCFEGNQFQTSAPAGLELIHGCGGLRLPLGYDPVALGGTLFVRAAHEEHNERPSYKTQPVPPPQPNMPDVATAAVHPAMHVFDGLHFDVTKAELPPETEAYLAAPPPISYEGPGAVSTLFSRWSYYFLFLLVLGWIVLALRDLVRREDMVTTSKLGWGAAVVALPGLGALAYHVAGRPKLSRLLRVGVIFGGLVLYLGMMLTALQAYGSR